MTIRSFVAAAAVLASIFAQPLRAQDVNLVLNNMAHEAIYCAAYFMTVSIALENSQKAELAQTYIVARDKVSEWAILLTIEAGLKEETIQARLDIAQDEMIAKIDGNTSNISILLVEYATLCKEVLEDPEARLRHWMNR